MIKVETITLDEKKHPFYIGLNALRFYKKETGEDLLPKIVSGSEMDTEMIVGLVYAGIKDGYRIAGKTTPYSMEDVADLLDQDFEQVNLIFKVLQNFPLFRGGETKGKLSKAK